jgi:hypothetical protein
MTKTQKIIMAVLAAVAAAITAYYSLMGEEVVVAPAPVVAPVVVAPVEPVVGPTVEPVSTAATPVPVETVVVTPATSTH